MVRVLKSTAQTSIWFCSGIKSSVNKTSKEPCSIRQTIKDHSFPGNVQFLMRKNTPRINISYIEIGFVQKPRLKGLEIFYPLYFCRRQKWKRITIVRLKSRVSLNISPSVFKNSFLDLKKELRNVMNLNRTDSVYSAILYFIFYGHDF